MMQAQDGFNADMPDGSKMTVQRGELLPDDHYLVSLDKGRNFLFKPYNAGGDAKPVKVSRAAAKAKGGD